MRVAIVHEWLQHYAGSERVLEQFLECFPDADVFAVVDFLPCSERGFLKGKVVKTSFVQKLPFAQRHFRYFLPLMPIAVEQFDLAGYDLIVSSNHAVAKGVITGPNQLHVCYVHSPMRYAWDLQSQYLRQAKLERGVKSAYARWILHKMRMWDVRTANGVDVFIANSNHVAARIKKFYRRESLVIHPPVDLQHFVPGDRHGATYLIASRFVPYKRVDLVAAAFALMPDRELLIVGDGSERKAVEQAASGALNIHVIPALEQSAFIRKMQMARAFVFPAEEDFGITMAEALACGTPVIAYGRGGARDIVEDGKTGVLFNHQTPESIIEAVRRFESLESEIKSTACVMVARRFGIDRFRAQISSTIEEALEKHVTCSHLAKGPARATVLHPVLDKQLPEILEARVG